MRTMKRMPSPIWQCLPDSLSGHQYYVPSGYGSEEKVRRRMQQLEDACGMQKQTENKQTFTILVSNGRKSML